MKNEPNSAGVSRWPSTSACINVDTRSSRGLSRRSWPSCLGVAVHRHGRGEEGLERAAEVGVAGAEDDVRPVEHVALVGGRDAEHVADDLQRQRGGERLDEVALALARPPSATSWRARTRTLSSIAATVFGVNARCTSRRSLEWRGSSRTIIEPKKSRASGRSSDSVMPLGRAEDLRLAADRPHVLVARHRPEPGALRRAGERVELGVEGDRAAVAQRGERPVALVERSGPELRRTELDVVDRQRCQRMELDRYCVSSRRTDRDPPRGHQRLGLGDGVLAEVEDRRRQHGVGTALDDALDEVLERADAAAGDDRHADGVDDGPRQLEVEALPGAVAVHRRQQDLARAPAGRRRRPRRRRRCPSACARRGGTPRTRRRAALGVDRAHDALGAELGGDLGDQLGPLDRGRVDADLVGAGAQHPPGVLDGADPAADGERDEHLLGRAVDDVDHRVAAVAGRRDVEEDQLVGALACRSGRPARRGRRRRAGRRSWCP